MNAKRTTITVGIFLFIIFVSKSLPTPASAADYKPDRNAVLGHLDEIINWYRDSTASLKPGEMPSDAIFQQNVRGSGGAGVQLAFEAGRAEAALLSESSAAGTTSGSGGAPAQNYGQMQEQHFAANYRQSRANWRR